MQHQWCCLGLRWPSLWRLLRTLSCSLLTFANAASPSPRCARVCVAACMRVSLHISLAVCVCARACVRACVRVLVYLSFCVCVCVCVSVCLCLCLCLCEPGDRDLTPHHSQPLFQSLVSNPTFTRAAIFRGSAFTADSPASSEGDRNFDRAAFARWVRAVCGVNRPCDGP